MELINKHLLPKEVLEYDFDKTWNRNFINYAQNKLFIGEKIHMTFDFIIEISPDMPQITYGIYSSDEIKEKSKELIKKKVPNHQKIIKEIDECKELNNDSLMKIYHNGNNTCEFEELLEDIRDIIAEKTFNELVLGRYVVDKMDYHNKKRKIILYVNNIKSCYPTNVKEGFEQTYIHELFHYFHSCTVFSGNNEEEFEFRLDYQSKVVKESLAKSFELRYMRHYYPNFDYDGSINELKKHAIYVYPYSGAAYIEDGHDFFSQKYHNYYEEFVKIYNMNFNDAVYYLLKNYRKKYYKVLNHDYNYYKNNFIVAKKSNSAKSRNKDYSKYEFEGAEYNKRRLVLAVIKKYVGNNPNITCDELIKAFPDDLNDKKTLGVIRKKSEVLDAARYFMPDPIKLKDAEVVVCNQWGIRNISIFIDNAEKLGFIIKTTESKINNNLLSFIESNEKIVWPSKKRKTNNNFDFDSNNTNLIRVITVDYDGDKENFIDMFERILDEKGFTPYKVEKETGVDRKTIKRILNAETEPTKITLIKICIGLNLDLETGTELLRKADYSVNDNYIDRLLYKCLKDSITDKDEIDDTLEAAGYAPLFRKNDE